MEARNWSEAEKHLMLALGEKHNQGRARLDLLVDLSNTQRKQRKLGEAEKTVQSAIELAAKSRNQDAQIHAMDSMVDLLLEQEKYGEAEKLTAEIARMESARPKPAHSRLAPLAGDC